MKKSNKFLIFTTIFLLLIFFGVRKIEQIAVFPGVGKGMIEIKQEGIEKFYADYEKGKVAGLFLDNKVRDTIVFFHGNGENLNTIQDRIKELGNLGYNVLAIDYPGFTETDGKPTEKNVYLANSAIVKKIFNDRKINQNNLIIFGYSVGTGSAVEFAKNNPKAKTLILMSGFTSIYDMTEKTLGDNIQKYFLMKNSFDNFGKLGEIKTPTLIIHGNIDEIVPFEMGEKNFGVSIGNPKKFIELNNVGHNDIFLKDMNNSTHFIKAFIEKNYWEEEKIILNGNEHDLDYLKKEIKFDFETDNSTIKYVSAKIPFDDLKYVPEDLEKIENGIIIPQKIEMFMRKEALENLKKMGEKFEKDFGEKIQITSSYRSYDYQKGIKDRGCSDLFCAKAGYSEHQTGLAVDLFEATSEKEFLNKPKLKKYFEWLKQNASDFGFINTYQKGLEIDTYVVEPWHWRYVGEDFAKILKEENLTFAEYYNINLSKNG